MKRSILFLALTLTQTAFGASSALSLQGVDKSKKPCAVYLDEESSVLLDGVKAYSLNLSFAVMNYRGILATQTSEGVFEFDHLMMDTGRDQYSRVIGAPITIAGIGILELKGQVDLRERTVKTLARGLSVFSWWKRADFCGGLQSVQN